MFGDRPKRRRGRARLGLDRTIRTLSRPNGTGRLDPDADAALIAVSRVLADNLDDADRLALIGEESRYTVATIAGRNLAALQLLLDRDDDADDDAFDEMFARLAHPTDSESGD